MKTEIVDGNHVIYGEWDDVLDYQFMVYILENGVDCIVFIMHGCDYGGGIQYYFKTKFENISNIVEYNTDLSDYEIKEMVENLPEAIAKR
jgi:hypothetical protein